MPAPGPRAAAELLDRNRSAGVSGSKGEERRATCGWVGERGAVQRLVRDSGGQRNDSRPGGGDSSGGSAAVQRRAVSRA
eukprot:1974889-Rhodomonas_salina.1